MRKTAWIIVMALAVFGCVLDARAAYLLAMDEDDQDFTLTVFDTDTGKIVESYTGSIPDETENVVYAGVNDDGDNVAYGIQSSSSSSSLYQFILSDDGSVSSVLIDTYDIGTVDAITIVGDTLYAVSSDTSTLYSIDTDSGDITIVTTLDRVTETWTNGGGHEKTNTYKYEFDDVEALAYSDGVLYGFDTDDNYLFSVDLDDGTVTLIGEVSVSGIEGLAFGDDGVLYATAGDTLYTIDVNTGSVIDSFDLSSWATDIEGLSGFTSGSSNVPEPGSVFAWLLVTGGGGYLVRRKRAKT